MWQWDYATLVPDTAVDTIDLRTWCNNGKKSGEIGDETIASSVTNLWIYSFRYGRIPLFVRGVEPRWNMNYDRCSFGLLAVDMCNCREDCLSFFEKIQIFDDPELCAHFLPLYCKHNFYLRNVFICGTFN